VINAKQSTGTEMKVVTLRVGQNKQWVEVRQLSWRHQTNRKQFHITDESKKRILLEPELKFGFTDLALEYATLQQILQKPAVFKITEQFCKMFSHFGFCTGLVDHRTVVQWHCLVYVMLSAMTNVLFDSISTFRSMFAVPSKDAFSSFFKMRYPDL